MTPEGEAIVEEMRKGFGDCASRVEAEELRYQCDANHQALAALREELAQIRARQSQVERRLYQFEHPSATQDTAAL